VLCLLKLPEEVKKKTIALEDNWERQLVTERASLSKTSETPNCMIPAISLNITAH
jgi:hypothetical protein